MSIRPCVVVPIYYFPLSGSDTASLHRIVSTLFRHPIRFIVPNKLQSYIKTHLLGILHSDIVDLEVYSVDDNWLSSISSYNHMCMSHAFYKLFASFTHILIAQLDTWIFSDQLIYWCKSGYSYIGAPWIKLNKTNDFSFDGAGNGGFSLRYIPHFLLISSFLSRQYLYIPLSILRRALNCLPVIAKIKFLTQYILCLLLNSKSLYPMHEDLFWAFCAPLLLSEYKVPPPHIAMRFSFEVEPFTLFLLNSCKLPFGCHAWRKYEPLFWEKYVGLK
jgi:hypothetical protein